MVSLQDMSSNGLYVNGIRIRKTAILLMNGDTIQIASRSISGQLTHSVHCSRDIFQDLNVHILWQPPHSA